MSGRIIKQLPSLANNCSYLPLNVYAHVVRSMKEEAAAEMDRLLA